MKGSIYLNHGRYWWKVKLPDSETIRQIPLIPIGAKYATKDEKVAEQIARMIWQKAVLKKPVRGETIDNLISLYMIHCRTYYQNSKETDNIEYALKFLSEQAGGLLAEDYSPLDLQQHREKIIDKGLARSTINKHIGMIQRMFKWGAAQQLVPITTYQALVTVENLRAGRSRAKETEKIRPVPESHVLKTLPYLSSVGRTMVQLQLLTGMRSTELCTIRPIDIETSGKVWIYRPAGHKTSFRGHTRIVAIGPNGQAILQPYLKPNITDYCFTTAKGNCYTHNSYRKMIDRAIAAAKKNDVEIPHWHPHQLRHTAGTKARKELGKEAARALLGHKNPRITDDYAEIDMTLAAKTALKIG